MLSTSSNFQNHENSHDADDNTDFNFNFVNETDVAEMFEDIKSPLDVVTLGEAETTAVTNIFNEDSEIDDDVSNNRLATTNESVGNCKENLVTNISQISDENSDIDTLSSVSETTNIENSSDESNELDTLSIESYNSSVATNDLPADTEEELVTNINKNNEIGTFPSETINESDNGLELTDELPMTITENIGDDCEITYNRNQNVFKPIEVGYAVKINDDLSSNIPFKENVRQMFK